MNQCVPSWDLDKKSVPLKLPPLRAHSNTSNISIPPLVPSLDYEVAELTWENGQLAMHGLTPPRVANKATPSSTKYPTWVKPRATGTLESVVNQATHHPEQKSAPNGGGYDVNEVVPWFDHQIAMVKPIARVPTDALVPCNNKIHRNDNQEHSTHALDQFIPAISTSEAGCSTGVGSCSSAAALDVLSLGINNCKTIVSVSESATCGGKDSLQVSLDTCEKDMAGAAGLTSTSLGSPENTSSAKDYTKTTAEDHDSGCYSISQRKVVDEEGKKKGPGKFSVSTKRNKAAANHNQSERKRRDKINQKMKALQKLVPNSSKTDKASMLDEVIEYLKQLQAQVQLMSRMNISPMMMQQLAMQQQLQMLMMAPMGMGMGMGIMDMNTMRRLANAYMPVASWDNSGGDRLPTPASIMPPVDPLSAFLECQSQSMDIDAYSKLAALYQQFQQSPVSGSASRI